MSVGPGVERVAVLLEHACPSAGLIEPVHDRHAVAPHEEADGRREPAESRPDHDDVGSVRTRRYRGRVHVQSGVGATR